MSEKILRQLPPDTIRLITSSQVITSVATAVKELVENSIDAGARNVQIKLDNYGFDTVEVKDDGHGISYDNVQKMFLPGYTSKITCFKDLERLETYGFRGEALSSLVKISKVSVTTKTAADALAMTYIINKDGVPESSKPSHLANGTIVMAKNLFGNLPVRRQYLSSKKKVADELKKIEHVVQLLSAIHPELRISLVHNKSSIWQKNSVRGIKQSFMQVMGLRVLSKMEHLNELQNNIMIDVIVPKKGLDNIDNIFTTSSQSVFSYVNRRPVILSKIFKVIMEHLQLQFSALNPTGKYAVCLLSVEVSPKEIDVNLEPNKTKVFLNNETDVMDVLDYMLSTYYGQNINRPKEVYEEPSEDTVSDEAEDRGRESKRQRIEMEEQNQMVINMRDKEFLEKNDGWHLTEYAMEKAGASSLCSQINKENCTLTTNQEEMELNRLMSGNTTSSLVTSVSVSPDDEKKQQNLVVNRPVEQDRVKPLLPDWPVRPVYTSTSKVVERENPDSLTEPLHITTSPPVEKEKFDCPIRPVPMQDLCPAERVPQTEPLDEVKVSDLLDVNLTDDVDMNAWSRGILEINGERLQGGAILARPQCYIEEDINQFDLSMRSVSSQMGKKEFSAFTKFARIVRPKILQEYPGMIFTKVASLLTDRWKALTPDERKYYERIAKEVDMRREAHKESKAAETNLEPEKKKKQLPTQMKPVRLEVTKAASLDSIIKKKRARSTPKENTQDDAIHLIGQLRPSGNWLYRKGCELGHVRHIGLHELILSKKMMSSHSVPREPTPQPMFIDKDVLGHDLWILLLELEMERDALTRRFVVTSPVITKNGFKVELETRGEEIVRGWITEIAAVIPFYGITDLKDCLSLYRSQGEHADLSKLRPVPVTTYIDNETFRIVRQAHRQVEQKDLAEWIETWEMCLSHLPAVCMHHREIFVPIYTMQKKRLVTT